MNEIQNPSFTTATSPPAWRLSSHPMKPNLAPLALLSLGLCCTCVVLSQSPGNSPQGRGAPDGGQRFFDGPPPGGPGGPGGFGGPRGFGGVRPDRKLVKDFDKDGDKRLDAAERKAARGFLATEAAEGRGQRRGFGPRGGFGGHIEPTSPGAKVSPADVKNFPGVPLYDATTLRTFFLEFEDADWEKELEDFHKTDVLVPAKLTVDGVAYPDVGVHFRGMSSYGMVRAGQKRSLNVSLDYAHEKQHLGGYRTLNLLNGHEDPIFMRSVLFYDIARQYLPAPKANFVRVVINGESWGVYVNVEQFNKDFVKEWFNTTKGARWKVPGSPGGRGSLAYLGEDPEAYKRIYALKSKDDPKSWSHLIRLCKVLNETPAEKLEAALEPILDVDGALRFLALDNALINNDGYWIRTSDYSIYEDEKGHFHVMPQDANETFVKPGGPGFGRGGRGPGGPGMGGGARIQGVELDPLQMANDPNKPLISKLLAVPALRARYLGYIREIAEKHLDWATLGPVAERYHALLVDEVKADTRKLESTEGFLHGLTEDAQGGGGPGGGAIGLKNFAGQRRAFLLKSTPAGK